MCHETFDYLVFLHRFANQNEFKNETSVKKKNTTKLITLSAHVIQSLVH